MIITIKVNALRCRTLATREGLNLQTHHRELVLSPDNLLFHMEKYNTSSMLRPMAILVTTSYYNGNLVWHFNWSAPGLIVAIIAYI